MSLIFYKYIDLVLKGFFFLIYIPNIFKTFQSYLFDRRHSNYKQQTLMWRLGYNAGAIQTSPIEVVCLRFSKGKFRIWVLIGEILINRYEGFILEGKTFYIPHKYWR